MKLNSYRTALILLISVLTFWQCSPKTDKQTPTRPSGFNITETDSATTANLEMLARVWGFTKYHHPAFYSRTAPNADSVIFRLMPLVAEASAQGCRDILIEWIDNLGEFTPNTDHYKDAETSTTNHTECNLSWIYDTSKLGNTLSERLISMRHADRRGTNYYVAPAKGASNPSFRNEAYYPADTLDTGYRLLALFRYWNIIEYYSPNRHLTDRPWDEVLPPYIERLITCGPEGYETTIAELITELDDSHATFSGHFLHRRYAPVQAQFIDGHLIVIPSQPTIQGGEFTSTQAAWPPMQFGDEIISVNNTPISELLASTAKSVSHSNEAALYTRTAQAATATQDGADSTTITFKRNGIQHTATLATLPATQAPKVYFPLYKLNELGMTMLTPTVAYLDALYYTNANSNAIIKAIQGTSALIVDLRRYPNEFMIYNFFGRHFVPQTTCNAIFTYPTYDLPGCWQAQPNNIGNGTNPNSYKGRVIALVNGNTISQAEYTAMTIQSLPNGCTVGSMTMGADGNISIIPLPGGFQTAISGLGVYYPDGSETQRCGIRIDYPATPTLEGVLAGRDEVLERALQICLE